MTQIFREILSVAKEFQRRGIASKLMEATEDVKKLREFELSGIGSEISSLANQCLMSRRGYQKVTETLLSSECGPDGSQLLVPDDGTDRVILVYKEL
ncbi:unnamed protein product [Caenorhabditis sp. 36 PRJEB53466]|nr:unnamed protein product [Caenorhabditis sp. 36 PRJEB53466]